MTAKLFADNKEMANTHVIKAIALLSCPPLPKGQRTNLQVGDETQQRQSAGQRGPDGLVLKIFCMPLRLVSILLRVINSRVTGIKRL
jgi:hypothetical protein